MPYSVPTYRHILEQMLSENFPGLRESDLDLGYYLTPKLASSPSKERIEFNTNWRLEGGPQVLIICQNVHQIRQLKVKAKDQVCSLLDLVFNKLPELLVGGDKRARFALIEDECDTPVSSFSGNRGKVERSTYGPLDNKTVRDLVKHDDNLGTNVSQHVTEGGAANGSEEERENEAREQQFLTEYNR